VRTWVIAVAAGVLIGAGATAAAFWLFSDGDEEPEPTREATARTGTQTSIQTGELILVDRPFRCRGPVDLDLVRVTIRTALEDAIQLDENCTGRIGRIEVETWTADGIVVQNRGAVAHDLVIESGYVKCHAFAEGAHQDGVQVMGGSDLTFRDLRIDCLGNANFFLSEGGSRASTPTNVVCEGCVLGPNSSQTLFYAASVRSGARETTICTGRSRAVRVEPEAEAIVEEENTVLPHEDPSCEDVTGVGGAG